MNYRSMTSQLLLSTALVGMAATAQAQGAPSQEDEVIVVGTQIRGSDIAGILPVTSLGEADIELTGAVSGDELLQAIPQVGDVTFTEARFTGVNGARGDVGSVNLRGVGDGNTLVLLNGRRLVNHPGTQAVNQTPVVSVNSNALPVSGIKRLEVLRDGASAVYGTDAVAGVMNTILDDDYEGLQVQLQYGSSEGTSLNETSGTFKWGKDFNDGRTNFSLFGNFMTRNGMPATDLRNSSTEDLRPFFEGTIYEGDSQFVNTSRDTPWGEFRTVSGSQISAIRDNDFHIQPANFPDCRLDIGNGLCADNSSLDRSTDGFDLRLDRSAFRDIVGDTDRYNLFGFVNHDLDNGMELFGEASYYHADYSRSRETGQILTSQRYAVSVPETAFYNPFGEAIAIGRYRPIDIGTRDVKVKNDSFRILGGVRGDWNNWDWETAFLHSEAETKDSTKRVSLTQFRNAIARTDASAYNPFAGAGLVDFSTPSTLNARNQSTIDSFIVDVKRNGTTKLTLADAKFSNPSIFSISGGDIGAAVGVEWRHEAYKDDRDDRLDGTTTFSDPLTGVNLISDVMGSSPTPDTNGSRDVFSAFAELAIPLVSPDMDFPLMHSFDVQLAARAESYSDVGSVVKPKIAASWHLTEGFQIRGAYSEGFRAPNLEQINATEIRRVNTGREDWILCEAVQRSIDPNTPFTRDDACDNVGIEGIRGGGPDLDPESSKNFSAGAVLELGNLTLTADWWRIEQEKLVGLFSDQNEVSLDYLLRLQGSSNPNVLRGTPDADDAALFESVGLAADGAGAIIGVQQTFTNLDLRESEGFDVGAQFDFDTDTWGDFKFKVNVAHIDKFFQTPSPQGILLLNASEAGQINSLVDVVGQADLIERNGNPEWRATGSVSWRKDGWGAGAFYKYVGDVFDTSVSDADYDNLAIPAFKTLNLYGEYTFRDLEENNLFEDTRIRLGVRNVGDKKPPVADEFARGYFVGLHSNRGRYWYGSVRKTF